MKLMNNRKADIIEIDRGDVACGVVFFGAISGISFDNVLSGAEQFTNVAIQNADQLTTISRLKMSVRRAYPLASSKGANEYAELLRINQGLIAAEAVARCITHVICSEIIEVGALCTAAWDPGINVYELHADLLPHFNPQQNLQFLRNQYRTYATVLERAGIGKFKGVTEHFESLDTNERELLRNTLYRKAAQTAPFDPGEVRPWTQAIENVEVKEILSQLSFGDTVGETTTSEKEDNAKRNS